MTPARQVAADWAYGLAWGIPVFVLTYSVGWTALNHPGVMAVAGGVFAVVSTATGLVRVTRRWVREARR